MRLTDPAGADPGEDAGPVVTGDLLEQAVGAFDHAFGALNGTGPVERLSRLRGPGRGGGGRGESAYRQRAGLQRGNVAVREGQQRVGGRDRGAERRHAFLETMQVE